MLKHHEKFRLLDENKANDFFFEVNWNPNDSKTNECKFIKVTFPDGREAIIRKEHFISVLFTMGSSEEQMKMIPEKQINVGWYETVVSVKATKDIKKGENITFPIKLSLPPREQEFISGNKRR